MGMKKPQLDIPSIQTSHSPPDAQLYSDVCSVLSHPTIYKNIVPDYEDIRALPTNI